MPPASAASLPGCLDSYDRPHSVDFTARGPSPCVGKDFRESTRQLACPYIFMTSCELETAYFVHTEALGAPSRESWSAGVVATTRTTWNLVIGKNTVHPWVCRQAASQECSDQPTESVSPLA